MTPSRLRSIGLAAICLLTLSAAEASSRPPSGAQDACAARSEGPAAGAARLMGEGVNLPGWEERGADDGRVRKGLAILRRNGFTHVRLPIDDRRLFSSTRAAFDNGAYLSAIADEVAALEHLGFSVSVDLHGSERIAELFERDPKLAFKVVASVWDDLSKVLSKTDPKRVFAELLNEPPTTPDIWNAGLPGLVARVRSRLPDHTIVVAPAGPQRHETLFDMPRLDDREVENLLSELKGEGLVDAAASLRAQIAEPFTAADIDAVFARIAEWSRERNRPVVVNEFGAYRDHMKEADRLEWLRAVASAAKDNCIGWAHWDYQDGFGLVDPATGLPDPRILNALEGRGAADR